MIIGIDDTGTVVEGEPFIVSIIFIRPSQFSNLIMSFKRWEKLTRKDIPDSPVEIKSTDLTDKMYRSFIKKIILNPQHPIHYRGFMINTDTSMLEHAEKQKTRYITQYEAAIKEAEKNGRTKWAKQAKTLTGWIRKTPNGLVLKMGVLNKAIPDAIVNAIGFSAVNDFDDELGELSIEIDEGFIKDKAINFWKEILRSNIISSTLTNPMPHLDTWTDEHPFIKAFYQETHGEFVVLSPEFPKRINFYQSSDSVAIRIADIVAGIMRKKYLYNWNDAVLSELQENVSENGKAMVEIKFTDNWDTPPEPNPYDIIALDKKELV